MDAEVCHLLQMWGLGNYINLFRQNSITSSSMALLGPAEIRELFPNIGHRTIFTRNLEEYRTRYHPQILTYATGDVYINSYPAPEVSSYLSLNYEDTDLFF
ncbi:uncharacterized protein LOC129913286 [Episyrphus balteatus]|uniref:uncharacterized protein LOC129913286 n=1 Tax=Episyrphus balteatus TaxID=286459 RepID=UPI0024864F7E|nr:uncharacterized protein LOC129913286 [Episyrphus balteatus]